jgi:biopolymer transport protein ExbD
MKTPKYQTRDSLEFNMTPMIDVTFLLIIFFLVSNRLAQQETQVALDLPKASSGEDLKEDDGIRRTTVNLKSDGAWLIAGQTFDEPGLDRYLAAERAKAEQIEVRIRCDRSVPYGRVKPILRQCLRNDVWKVTFAVVNTAASGKPGG